jgi:transposase-like protein
LRQSRSLPTRPVLERAARMDSDAKVQFPPHWASIESIGSKIDCTAQRLRKWVRQGERASGELSGPSRLAATSRSSRTAPC